MTALDRRLNAFRPDIADARLAGKVEARRFVEGRPVRIAVPVADLHSAPDDAAGVDTQLVFGQSARLFDEREGWAWLQALDDGYVGYLRAGEIAEPSESATHRVVVPRTFLYPGPDMKRPAVRALSMGSLLAITDLAETRGTTYAVAADGSAVVASHLGEAATVAADFVAVAETLERTPYLWGGTSGFGVDCSGLVQLSMRMAGSVVLRDTDMQAASIGQPLDIEPGYRGLRRGDLVFWRGHVGIMTDDAGMIHASGHAMMVVREPLAEAVERIGHLYGPPTVIRRP